MAEHTFSFLVTTDNHMGYKEDDHLRRKDSYMAFGEALKVARAKDVDFILLGGDLFHNNRPSASVEHKCIKIIRQHMNAPVERTTSFKRVSGQFSHFHKLNHANFEDANLTVPYPIMTIHGNHDDPTGPNAKSVCEKLATCGLLNYFGVVEWQDGRLLVRPIILQKGTIKIALYGMGFIPDFKLKAAFDRGEVIFEEPPKDTFSILVVHQNRIPHDKSKYIPDELYPQFIHLLIRGHEHDTQSPQPLPESQVGGLVYQPGSTVATSISTMEMAPKKVAVFHVKPIKSARECSYEMSHELIDLTCCRPMLFKDVTQKDLFKSIKETAGTNKLTSVEFRRLSCSYVENCIQRLIDDANSARKLKDVQGDGDAKLTRFHLPLVRIRLEYVSRNERFDELELASKFYPNKVANKDLVLFKKQKLIQIEGGDQENATFANEFEDDDEQDEFEHINLGEQKKDTIDVMIESYFMDRPADERLKALSLTEYTNAVRGSAEDGNVISKVLNKKKDEVMGKFKLAIQDEKVARQDFHDLEKVRKWFVRTFAEDASSQGSSTVLDIMDDLEFTD